MKRFLWSLGAVLFIGTTPITAQPINFDDGWEEQRFSLFSGNTYVPSGEELGVISDATVSLLWSPLPEHQWSAQSATWTWSVERSAPPTDLTQKGGDDRNLSLYFVFLPDSEAERLKGKNIRQLLGNEDVRVLLYVWGGAHTVGDILPSPYLGENGRTIILQPAEVGRAQERVDLRADFERAFDMPATNLVGLAVSADGDDTNSDISARIEQWTLN